MKEPKSPLTSARMFDKTSDAELADWLDTDAQAMDGQPGRNNHVAATRAAAERLRRPTVSGVAEHSTIEDFYAAEYGDFVTLVSDGCVWFAWETDDGQWWAIRPCNEDDAAVPEGDPHRPIGPAPLEVLGFPVSRVAEIAS